MRNAVAAVPENARPENSHTPGAMSPRAAAANARSGFRNRDHSTARGRNINVPRTALAICKPVAGGMPKECTTLPIPIHRGKKGGWGREPPTSIPTTDAAK